MPLVEVPWVHTPNEDRRKPDIVLKIQGGPSRVGSTYWGRVLHCPREHFLSNMLGWQSTAPHDPLDHGIIWHWALEHYYIAKMVAQQTFAEAYLKDWEPRRGMQRIESLEFFQADEAECQKAAFRAIHPFMEEPGYDEIFEKMTTMLGAYFEKYRFDRWQIVAVEPVLEMHEDVRGFPYSSRMDLVIIDHSAASEPTMKHVEHKSTWRMNLQILEGYVMDSQVLGQVYLCSHLLSHEYPPYVGGIVNITSKEKRPKLERIAVQPSDEQLADWEASMRVWNGLRAQWPQYGYPRNYGSCTRRFGRCEHFEFCRLYPTVQPEQIVQLGMPPRYRKTSAHEENQDG